jgi:AhpD family alkylhydroperoxidase
MNFKCNCCDGIYNSFDVHFTSSCDNKCSHCIDTHFEGLGIKKPNVFEITETIISNWKGYDDVLFLGGEPCLYLEELYNCITELCIWQSSFAISFPYNELQKQYIKYNICQDTYLLFYAKVDKTSVFI